MEQKNLDEIKDYIQKLLDKYLPIEQRFSIKNFDEELTFILIDLLLEKDESKRDIIYSNMYDKMLQLNNEIESTYQQVVKIVNKIILWKIQEREREELEKFDKSFDEKLKNI